MKQRTFTMDEESERRLLLVERHVVDTFAWNGGRISSLAVRMALLWAEERLKVLDKRAEAANALSHH